MKNAAKAPTSLWSERANWSEPAFLHSLAGCAVEFRQLF